MQKIEKIFSTYTHDKSSWELEFRVNVDAATFRSVHEIYGSEDLTKSFVVSAGVDRTEKFYEKKTRVRLENLKKTTAKEHIVTDQEFAMVYGIKGKLVLSKEIPINSSVTKPEFYRIKFRSSKTLGAWRLDLTASIEPKNTNEAIDVVKKTLIDNPITATSKNLIECVDELLKSYKLVFSIEAEHTSNSPSVEDIRDLKPVFEMLQNTDTGISDEIKKISKALFPKKYPANTLKQLLDNPVALMPSTYYDKVFANIDEFFVTEKTDGRRVLLVIENSVKAVFAEEIKELDFTKTETKIMLDCEYADGKFYAFDLLFHGRTLEHETFETRYAMLQDKKSEYPDVIVKEMTRLHPNNLESVVKAYASKKNIDGLIFTRATKPYHDSESYKYKPAEHNSIDFLIVRPLSSQLGLEGLSVQKNMHTYVLCCGIQPEQLTTLSITPLRNFDDMIKTVPDIKFTGQLQAIQFSPSIEPDAYVFHSKDDKLHGHIGEFIRKESVWELVKLREDRDVGVRTGSFFGNNYTVAEEIFMNYYHPFTLEMLWNNTGQYFQTVKSPEFRNMIAFNNFVKAHVLRQTSGAKKVVDLASGKGQDMFLYNGFNVREILFNDIDKFAITEALKRKLSLNNPKYYKYGKPPKKNMKIHVNIVDLTQNYKKVLDGMARFHMGNADFVVINLAIHYLVNEKGFFNVFQIVDGLLKSGGIFIFTTFCGEKIADLMRQKPGELNFNDPKFGIKAVTALPEPNVTQYRNKYKITVKHPFSKNEYYEENLVNVDEIISQFTSFDYELLQDSYFSEFLPKYSGKELTPAEKEYVGLYKVVSLRKST